MRKHDGLRKIIIIRYDIDHLLKFAKKKDGEGWVEIVSTLEEVQETTKKTFYLNNKIMRSLPPERGINIVCLFISAGAPAVAIGPTVGTPTGLAIGLGLLAVIRAQSSASGTVRNTYFLGAWIIRIFSGAFEVMAYTDVFSARTSLPFELSPIVWAWATALFMAALDLWALEATATSARAAVEAAEYEGQFGQSRQVGQGNDTSARHRKKKQKEPIKFNSPASKPKPKPAKPKPPRTPSGSSKSAGGSRAEGGGSTDGSTKSRSGSGGSKREVQAEAEREANGRTPEVGGYRRMRNGSGRKNTGRKGRKREAGRSTTY